MAKKKILLCNESSTAASGFGTYGNEILTRLHSQGYDIAEFAMGVTVQGLAMDPKPWPQYANNVRPNDPRHKEFVSKPTNKFGEWRFERVLIDYRPDIVIDIRDPWCFAHQANSPLRKYFNWAIMPTVDSAPQKEEWIDSFCGADAVFTYTDWGGKVIQEQSHNKIEYKGTASPGVDLKTYVPIENLKEHRKRLGFNENAVIIGMVARNQVRKLYPDLFQAFRKFMDDNPELSENVYLYCHTSYPDVGWNLAKWSKYYGIGHKVLFSYICEETNEPFVSRFQGARTYSPHSNAPTGIMPNTNKGFDRRHLAQVYQLFDYYVQYATCEGFGMPMAEAAACGVPISAVNYSAMEDVVEKTKGFPLKVQRFFHDLGTESVRALPDVEFTAKTFVKMAKMSPEEWKKKSNSARKAAERYFDWDKTAQTWADYIDNVELTGRQGQWNAPIDLPNPPASIPEGMDNKDFVNWIYRSVIDEPHRRSSTEALTILEDLNYGWIQEGSSFKPVDQQKIFKTFLNIAQNKIVCEQNRVGLLKPAGTDYINFARGKM